IHIDIFCGGRGFRPACQGDTIIRRSREVLPRVPHHHPLRPQHLPIGHVLQHIQPGGQPLQRQYAGGLVKMPRRPSAQRAALQIQQPELRALPLGDALVFEQHVERLSGRVGIEVQRRGGGRARLPRAHELAARHQTAVLIYFQQPALLALPARTEMTRQPRQHEAAAGGFFQVVDSVLVE
ncbi:hypothetical protein RZS08_11030, partial [Arthrospira platensis SPKY1]|nr:hypothetical protein [Arthrospira platensis SPKY1]